MVNNWISSDIIGYKKANIYLVKTDIINFELVSHILLKDFEANIIIIIIDEYNRIP
jgi:hypothetical protein